MNRIASLISRPITYFGQRPSQGLGTLLSRAFAGRLWRRAGLGAERRPAGIAALICDALTAVIAVTLNLIFGALLGLSALCVDDAGPLYWAWQKLSFLANGSPFPTLFYGAGRIASGGDRDWVWRAALILAAWNALEHAAPSPSCNARSER